MLKYLYTVNPFTSPELFHQQLKYIRSIQRMYPKDTIYILFSYLSIPEHTLVSASLAEFAHQIDTQREQLITTIVQWTGVSRDTIYAVNPFLQLTAWIDAKLWHCHAHFDAEKIISLRQPSAMTVHTPTKKRDAFPPMGLKHWIKRLNTFYKKRTFIHATAPGGF